jgi:hypothetical protein
MRFPRHVRPLVLARKKNAVGKDCKCLAGAGRVCHKPRGHVASQTEKLSPMRPACFQSKPLATLKADIESPAVVTRNQRQLVDGRQSGY